MANSPISRWDVRVVFATTLTVRAYIPRWTSLDFSDQLSDVGSGKITLDHNDTFVEQFDLQYGDGVLFDGTHAIQILRDGVLAYTFLIEDVDVQRVGYSQETVIAGRGIAAQLDWAIILPENYSASMNQVSLETAGQQLLARELVGYEFLVRVATTTNLSATHSTGTDGTGRLTASANGAFPTLDGTDDIVVTDTILVKDQTNTAHNGVYSVDDAGSISTPWILIRVSDLNFYESRYCYAGARVFVSEGTSNGENAFQIDSCPASAATEPGKGTTALTFIPATTVYTAVAGFYILFTEASTGNELSMLRGASWGTIRSGYGRGGIGNAISWALSLESTLNTAKGLTDSKGSTPKDGGNITLDFGRSLLETIQTVCEQTECHWHVSASGVVSIARKPNNLYTVPFGTDRTSGSSAVMLPLPLANSSQTKTSARDLRSTVFGSNSYLIDYSTDNDITATHGRREGFYTSSGNDNEAVSNISSAGLKKAAGLTFGVEIDFVETLGRQAFINFDVGDKILIEYKIGSYESRIVNGISVSIDSSMQTNVQLTLEAVVPDSLVKLQNQSIYGTSQGSRLKAYLNSGNERVAAASVRTTPISTVEGMSNRVEVSWNISGSANASGYEATVYRTDSLNRASAISRTSSYATVTTPDAHGIQVGDLVTVSIVNPTYSTFSATNAVITAVNTASLTEQTFTYANSGANVSGSLTDASTVDGGIKVSSWARVNNAVTLTTARNHGLLVGERIIVADTTDTTVDAFKVVITAVPSTTTLKYSNPGPDASGTPAAATVKKIVEFHSTQASAYQTSATVEGLATSGRPYLTQIISLNSSGEQCESTVPVSFFSSENAMEVVGGAIKSPNYIAGSAGWFIGSSGMAEFSDVTVRGVITSTSGTIGGWTIDSNSLFSGTKTASGAFTPSTGEMTIGSDGHISANKFRVNTDGSINATAGTIGGWTLDSNSLFSGTKTASGAFTPSTGEMTIGSDGHISANKFRVNTDGSVNATTGTIGPVAITTSSMNSQGSSPYLNTNSNYYNFNNFGDVYIYSNPGTDVGGTHVNQFHSTALVGEYISIKKSSTSSFSDNLYEARIGDTQGTYAEVLVQNSSASTYAYMYSTGNIGLTGTLNGYSFTSGRHNGANQMVHTDGNGYLQVGYINSSNGNEGNNSSPSRVWGTNGSDDYLRSYLTSALSVSYAATAGNANNLQGYVPSNFVDKNGSTMDGALFISMSDAQPLRLQRNYAVNGNFIQFWNANSIYGPIAIAAIEFNGTGAVRYQTTSDSRLKENIEQIENACELISKLNPVKYNSVYDGPEFEMHGFLAQEMYEVYKFPVSVGSDNPRESPWGIDYGQLTPLLTAALKEAIIKIDSLDSRVKLLEGPQ